MVPLKEADKQIVRQVSYTIFAAIALWACLVNIGYTVVGLLPNAFIAYAVATVLRLGAGAAMNRMGGGDPATVNYWNNKYHRYLVIALDSVVGAVLLGRLTYDWFAHRRYGEPLAFLVTVIFLYFVIAKFTRPNTWGARVRSAFLTVAIAMVMAWINWPHHVSWVTTAAVIVFCGAGYRLSQLQHRLGWADR